jgi:CPA2 family monovalent cation:H+ antiporter-2
MSDISYLQDILIILGLALANAMLFTRLRQSPVIGYLATGMLVGPYGFHLVRGVHEVEQLAELGVVLLLFTIGLEFPAARILRLKNSMLRGGGVQVALTAAILFAGGRLAGLGAGTALALALPLTLSSTAVVLKLLLERGETDAAHGQTALAILLFQDVCVVFFLIVLPLASGELSGVSATAILEAAALLGGLALAGRYLLRPLLRAVLGTRSAELFRLTLLTLVLGTAWLTAAAGLSLALGAFLAGLFLAESDYAHQALADILPFRDTFLALFFVSMGMLVDLHYLGAHLPLVIGLLLLLAALKMTTGAAGAAAAGCPLRVSLQAGLLLFQVGEFSFVLLKQGLTLGLLDAASYQPALSVVALSLIATPLVTPRAAGWAAVLAKALRRHPVGIEPETKERAGNLQGHIIIAGFGLTGRNIGRLLREARIPYVFVEFNGAAVRRGRQQGEFIVYGDATSPTLLEGLGIARARGLVLAINDPSAVVRAIRAGRELNDKLLILTRTRYLAELDDLHAAGADGVIPDELEASLQLAATLLSRCGLAEGRILQMLSDLRREHYSRLRRADEKGTPGGLSVLEGGQIEFQAVPDDSPGLGLSLADLAFRTRTGAMVAGVVRHEHTIYGPPAELVLKKGDTLILLGDLESVARARELIHGHIVK